MRTLCGFVFMACSALAQIASFANKPIVDIQFSAPNALDAADLAQILHLKKGDQLTSEGVASAIDDLFATGRFSDIAVEAEPSGAGVLIRFVTQPAWFFGGLVVEGKIASPPNRTQLQGTTELQLGGPFHDEDVTQAVNTIRDTLKANGLYDVDVTPQVVRDPDSQQAFLTIQIKERKRAKYDMPVLHTVIAAEAADRSIAPANAVAANNAEEIKLSDAVILRATGWRIPLIHWWRQVTDSRTRKGVQGVLTKYESKDRLTAKAELNKLDYDPQRNRVRPELTITPGPKVEIKAVEAKVSRGTLKKYVPVFQEHTVNNDLLAEGKHNLSDYFQSQGYYDVDVDIRTTPPQNGVETIQYVISQGQRYKLVHLAFTGNHYFPADAFLERMFLAPKGFLVMRHGRYSEAFRQKDEENIANLYMANGFRDVKVTSAVDRNYQGKAGYVSVTMHVEEGTQWQIDNVALNGVALVKKDDLTKLLSSIPGQPFAEINLANDRNQMLTYYYERGYPDVKLAVGWQPSGTPKHVNVTYTVTEGGRQYVRGILTSGVRITRRSIVDKNITLKPGDPLSPTDQVEIQKHFYDLGLFARVDTAVENPGGSTDHKYIIYNFEEANRYLIGIGLGASLARFGTPSTSSLASPGGSTGVSPQVSLDVTRINFLGLGQSVALHSLYSKLEKRGSINYLIPHLWDTPGRDLTFTVLYDDSLNVNTFSSRRAEVSTQLANRFSKTVTATFVMAYRRVSVGSVIIPTLLIPQLLQPVRIGIVSGTLVHDRRDDKGNPHHGMYNTADIGVAGKFFGSQRSFGRILLRNATYHPLSAHWVLARQTQFGIIAPFAAPTGLTQQESVPLPERFFGGGADSLRAFPYNQAGPRDTGAAVQPGGPASEPTGFPLGGNALFFNNVELRFPFLGPDIQGVFFHDMGNVFSTLGSMSFRVHQRDLQDFNYMVHAAGFGIRYRTPVGPIRLDLAYSINPPAYLGFGGTPAQILKCDPSLPPQGVCVSSRQTVSHIQFFFSIGQTF